MSEPLAARARRRPIPRFRTRNKNPKPETVWETNEEQICVVKKAYVQLSANRGKAKLHLDNSTVFRDAFFASLREIISRKDAKAAKETSSTFQHRETIRTTNVAATRQCIINHTQFSI